MSALVNYTSELGSNSVHVWSCQAIENSDHLNELIKILSEDEVLRANKFRFEKDKAVYITAKYLLRSGLSNYLQLKAKEIIFDYSEYGKPSFMGNVEIDFNVSHSGNRIIIGFARNRTIGVDIEKIKENFDPLELAENFFSEEEIKALSETKESERFQAFYRCWTRKESFIKAVGEGLSYPLDSFAVTMDNDKSTRFIKIDNIQDSKRDWQLHSFVPADKYIAALTTDGAPQKIEFFNADDFLF